jgi:HSP20 family protein
MALAVRRTQQQSDQSRRRDPFGELEDLQLQLAQLLDSVASGELNGGVWAPPVDVEETEDAWVVEAELPGVDRKDVDVEVRGSELVVSGEIKERERTGILRRRTRRTGAFAYTVTLPGDPDPDGIEAVLDNGVLRVTVPKRERTQPRRVEVRSG